MRSATTFIEEKKRANESECAGPVNYLSPSMAPISGILYIGILKGGTGQQIE
jgi:hypothetical protein